MVSFAPIRDLERSANRDVPFRVLSTMTQMTATTNFVQVPQGDNTTVAAKTVTLPELNAIKFGNLNSWLALFADGTGGILTPFGIGLA
mmetsp:Transcript_24643/g.69171  ORF Transcript_24643/g.69171 Transcript_24643/m.69171 type:complete len:88 (+) Transcript_24643:79-342(+)